MLVQNLLYGRQRLQPLFHQLHGLALRGLNYGCGDPRLNGEYALLDRLALGWDQPVVFDVGGFRGDWSAAVLARAPHATVHTFEPNSVSHEHIRRRLEDSVELHRIAFGAEAGTGHLSAPPGQPAMGSLHERDLRHLGQTVAELETVAITTIDAFCNEHGVGQIDLVKLDVEGNELAAIHGASEMLKRQAITAVQFEFGGTSMDARVFLRDFRDALDGYRVFRILRDGLDPLEPYDESAEIFTFSNFVAMRSDPH